jgi:hypothetical protein
MQILALTNGEQEGCPFKLYQQSAEKRGKVIGM